MNAVLISWMSLFWALQIIANIFFKWGSDGTLKWVYGFALGHAFGMTSMAVLMHIYKSLNPNLAFGIGVGGAFLLTQLAIVWVFKTELAPAQYAGILTVVIGMALIGAGSPANA